MVNGLVKIGRNSLIYWLASAIPLLVGFFILPVYTRYMTPTDYGVLGMLAAIASPLGVIFCLQLNVAVLRFFFDYEGDEEKTYLGTMFVFLMIYAIPLALILIFFGQPLFKIIFKSEELAFYPLIVWQIIVSYLALAWIVPSAVFKARQEAYKWASCALASFVLGTALTMYFIIVHKEGAMGVVRASLIAQSIMTVVYIYIISRNVSFRFQWSKLKESLLFTLPLVPNAFIGIIFAFADRWFLEHYYTLVEVGLYTMALRFGQLPGMLYSASGDAWMPVFFNTANKDETQAKSLLSRTITFWAAGGGLVTLVVAFFSREVIMVMTTPQFYPAHTIIPILVFGGLLAGVYFYPRYAILFVKKTKMFVLVTWIAGSTKVLANYLLIPLYGMFGAAFSGLIANVITLIIIYLIVWKYYPLRFEYTKLAKIFGMVVILLVGVYFLSTESWFINVPMKLGALVLYVLGLVFFGVVEKSLLVQIKNNLNWKTIISVLKG